MRPSRNQAAAGGTRRLELSASRCPRPPGIPRPTRRPARTLTRLVAGREAWTHPQARRVEHVYRGVVRGRPLRRGRLRGGAGEIGAGAARGAVWSTSAVRRSPAGGSSRSGTQRTTSAAFRKTVSTRRSTTPASPASIRPSSRSTRSCHPRKLCRASPREADGPLRSRADDGDFVDAGPDGRRAQGIERPSELEAAPPFPAPAGQARREQAQTIRRRKRAERRPAVDALDAPQLVGGVEDAHKLPTRRASRISPRPSDASGSPPPPPRSIVAWSRSNRSARNGIEGR
jgi:hypothetical protein